MGRVARTLVIMMVLMGAWSIPARDVLALSVEEAMRTAHLRADLLDAGRTVIDRSEDLINDPRKGEKGFTAAVFEQKVIGEYRERTGLDLAQLRGDRVPPLARELLPVLLQVSKEVVDEAQLVINQRGVDYKNFIPATFASQAAARFSARSHVRLKQTALRPRNQKNAPDTFEAEIMSQWMAQAGQGGGVPRTLIHGAGDAQTLRVLTPLYYGRRCLACHGSPVGEMDISGYPKEGAREGDLAGAISVVIPIERH